MGFPLHRGSVCDGILTCHWHHARFDLCTGGTFDQWADDLRRFPVEVEGDDVLRRRLAAGGPARATSGSGSTTGCGATSRWWWRRRRSRSPMPTRAGRTCSRRASSSASLRRGGGWFRGLTTLTCLMNLVPRLEAGERAAALYHGARRRRLRLGRHGAAVPARPAARAESVSTARLGRWFRSFIEVRDAEGAERALVSAVRAGASPEELADMLFAAATDHRYLDGGHTLDFVNKALEALDTAGWERAEAVLASLPPQLAFAERMEESNAWRNPVDLVALLEDAFERLPAPRRVGRVGRPGRAGGGRARRRAGRDPRRAARGARRRRRRGRARLGGHLRGGDADRSLPDQQRVRRLGHGAAHVHVRERGRAGAAALAVARAAARRARRGHERPPRPLPQRARGAAADAAGGRGSGGAARGAAGPARRASSRSTRRASSSRRTSARAATRSG